MTSVSEVCITVRRTGPRDHRSPVANPSTAARRAG